MASKKTSGRPVVPTGRSGPSRKPARVRKTVSVRAPSPEKASSPKAMVVKRSPSSALERETSKVLSLKAEIARKFWELGSTLELVPSSKFPVPSFQTGNWELGTWN